MLDELSNAEAEEAEEAMTMTARNKFQKGDRVVQNERCPRTNADIRDGLFRSGVVVGFGRQPDLVRVQWDDMQSAITYHMRFIDREADK